MKFSNQLIKTISYAIIACFYSIAFAHNGVDHSKDKSSNMDSVMIKQVQIRAMPPGSPSSAAYLVMHNHSDKDQVLVAAEMNDVTNVEIHQHVMVDGNMQMRQVEKVIIPAGEVIVFAPGGFHIMLIGLERPFKVGENVPLSLTFESGDVITVNAKVVMPEDIDLPMPEKHKEMHSHSHS
jgi:periplasmic copper chaperone A